MKCIESINGLKLFCDVTDIKSWNEDILKQEMAPSEYDQQHVVPYMEVCGDVDGGYSSHSTCSSCPVDSQFNVEQVSQVDNTVIYGK